MTLYEFPTLKIYLIYLYFTLKELSITTFKHDTRYVIVI